MRKQASCWLKALSRRAAGPAVPCSSKRRHHRRAKHAGGLFRREQPAARGTLLPVHYWVPLSIAPSSLAVETHTTTTEIWIALAGEMTLQLSLSR
jgi:hypothetical protein